MLAADVVEAEVPTTLPAALPNLAQSRCATSVYAMPDAPPFRPALVSGVKIRSQMIAGFPSMYTKSIKSQVGRFPRGRLPCVCVCAHAHARVYMHACMCAVLCVCVLVCVRARVRACVCVCARACSVRAGRKQSAPQVCKMGVNVFGAPSKKESVLVTIDPKHTATSKADDLRYTAGLAWLVRQAQASQSHAHGARVYLTPNKTSIQ